MAVTGVAMAFDLPEDLLEETFLASTGPGGQNVNKVATACQLRVDAKKDRSTIKKNRGKVSFD